MSGFVEKYREHCVNYKFIQKENTANLIVTYKGEISEDFKKEIINFIKRRCGTSKVNNCKYIMFTYV